MSTGTYGIDDGHGNEITTGLSGHIARQTAQRLADERGETVTLYRIDEPAANEEVEPTRRPAAAPTETRLEMEDRILAKHGCVVEPSAFGGRVIRVLDRHSRAWPLDGETVAACRAELERHGISTAGWLTP